MRICTLSREIGPALERLGHEVLNLSPEGQAVLDLPALLAERNFTPELVFQEETLGPRMLLSGLERLPCPKIFWSVDTHLNRFWHLPYLRLFDGVMSPHVSILQDAPGRPPLARLARVGYALPWRPFAERERDVVFVGRFTSHRPGRQWLADFLIREYQATIAQDIPLREMLGLYGQARLAPNEAILSEVNFRLVEAASCGCLVLSQDVGPDQDALFTPGREIETFGHVLELKGLMDYYLARPDKAEALARAAWERVRAEHLAEHRGRAILDFAEKLPRRTVTDDEARTAFWLTLLGLKRTGLMDLPWEPIARGLTNVSASPEVMAGLFRLWAEAGRQDLVMGLAAQLIATPRPAAGQDAGHAAGQTPVSGEGRGTDLDLDVAASLAGLRTGDLTLARQFWFHHCRLQQRRTPERPDTAVALCLLWAGELVRAGRPVNPGFRFDPETHVPASAAECLYLAKHLDPGNLELDRRLDALFAGLKGCEFVRLGHLSTLSLHDRENWRLGLTLGLTNLKVFRMEQGVEEIVLAQRQARAQGREAAFRRALDGMDPKGYVRATLDAMDQAEAAASAPLAPPVPGDDHDAIG